MVGSEQAALLPHDVESLTFQAESLVFQLCGAEAIAQRRGQLPLPTLFVGGQQKGFDLFNHENFSLKVESAHVGRNNHRKIAAFFRTLVSDARKKAHPLPGGRAFKAHLLPGGLVFKAHPLPGGLASPNKA